MSTTEDKIMCVGGPLDGQVREFAGSSMAVCVRMPIDFPWEGIVPMIDVEAAVTRYRLMEFVAFDERAWRYVHESVTDEAALAVIAKEFA